MSKNRGTYRSLDNTPIVVQNAQIMGMNYIEARRGASKEDLRQYADGISQMEQLAQNLQSQGELPERFAPEPSRLHPSLEGKIRTELTEIGGRDFKTPFTEIVGKFAIKDNLTLEKTREILEKVRKGSVQINAASVLLLSRLVEKQINISRYSLDMLRHSDFTTLPQTEQIELGIGPAEALVPNPKGAYATTEEIWAARDEKGLEPVPAETALHYLLQKGDQLQIGNPIWFSMKTIAGRRGDPSVFGVERDDNGLWLYGYWTRPSSNWDPGDRFAFSLPQVTNA